MASDRKIKTHFDRNTTPYSAPPAELRGCLQGKETYLWFGKEDGRCMGTLSGYKLYRLARAIVREYETRD